MPAHQAGRKHEVPLPAGATKETDTHLKDGTTQPVCYEIRVRGVLGDLMLGAFPDLDAQAHGAETVLSGPLADQAALYGLLAQLEALGLELLEVRRIGC